MDLANIPLLGPLFEKSREWASQGLIQRAAVYFGWYLVMVLVASWLVKLLGWYNLIGVGGVLFVALLLFVVVLMGIDPENEYTKEDVLALTITGLFMPVALWAIKEGASGGLGQLASPVILMAETAGKTAATGVSAPAASAIAQYFGNAMMNFGSLFFAMGLKYVFTE